MTGDAELGDWLRLLLVPGIGRETARQLLARYGDPAAVLSADDEDLARLLGAPLAEALRKTPADWSERLDATLDWRRGGPQRSVLTLGDAEYPRSLLEGPDPPLLLHVQGDPAHLSRPAIAVVGSRRLSAQGRDHAHDWSRRFAEAGYVVVSGMAVGIDAAAHEGALAGGGATVAVVGTGPDRVYPRQHRELAHRIAGQGALVSEYFVGTAPLAENFPQRNRIIAGLAQGTLVVEAALQSGSLITARLANEAGREVFAIPGSIRAQQSRGCHALIRDGAQLVESPDEVLQALRAPWLPGLAPAAAAAAAAPAPDSDPLLQALGQDPMTGDELQARTGWPMADLLARLLELELDGRVARLPGGQFQRRHRA
ncbi:MAG: DNA-processing protein DprA [Rubrivivax sp.]